MATKVTVSKVYTWDELKDLPDQTVVSVYDPHHLTPHVRMVTRDTGNHIGFREGKVASALADYYRTKGPIFRVTGETCHVEFR